MLDKFRNNPTIDSINLWRAEWNLLNFMKNHGQIQKAFFRINKLIQNTSTKSVPPDLTLRLIWLKAELSLESGHPQETTQLLDSLLTLLQSSAYEKLDLEQTNLIASHALLLKAQALFELNEENQALKIISTLRETYPKTKPVILSHILEAHHYASINNSTKAQQQLINLSDNFPESEYAPIALYEAALNAESRNLKNTYQEALAILERLNLDYPNSPLAYQARFKQADILRKLADFSNAQLIYESLIKQHPNHPEKYRAQLAYIDCLFAQALNNPTALSEISTQYTQLLDLPLLSPNIRAEAGFKSGFTLIKALSPEPAKEILWLTITTLLIDADISNQLNDQGRYWIARSIFELGSIFEKTGSIKEANEVYQLISAYNLPGTALANSKIK